MNREKVLLYHRIILVGCLIHRCPGMKWPIFVPKFGTAVAKSCTSSWFMDGLSMFIPSFMQVFTMFHPSKVVPLAAAERRWPFAPPHPGTGLCCWPPADSHPRCSLGWLEMDEIWKSWVLLKLFFLIVTIVSIDWAHGFIDGFEHPRGSFESCIIHLSLTNHELFPSLCG